MSILRRIVEQKNHRISSAKARNSLRELKSMIADLEGTRDFAGSIRRGDGPVRLIAEIKKASPSRGLIRPDFDPRGIAAVYRSKGADAISVITEEDFFQGSLSFLTDVRGVTELPLLRKDFIIDEYQIYEARANRADAVLLIASILGQGQAADYLHLAAGLGLAVLFEVHDRRDLEKAVGIGAPIVGVNNRDLVSLRVDLDMTLLLRNEIPPGRIVVSESGIRDRDDVRRLEDAGVDAMLIGTAFMEAPDIGAKMEELLNRRGDAGHS